MSYDQHEEAMDDFIEKLSKDIYPDHRTQAIQEFTAERLKSFYIANPNTMLAAVGAYNESKKLLADSYYSAAIAFSVTAIEIFLKATLLKPVVSGLVLNETLSIMVIEDLFRQPTLVKYEKMLSGLFAELAEIDISSIKRDGVNISILKEVYEIQKKRNLIIHQGEPSTIKQAKHALQVVEAVFKQIVLPMLNAIGLHVKEKGVIYSL